MDLNSFAREYIWWMKPAEAVCDPHRVIAQVMGIGTLEDVEALRQLIGNEAFRQTLREARPGEFSDRSWHYWHLVLDMAGPHAIPSLPVRKYE